MARGKKGQDLSIERSGSSSDRRTFRYTIWCPCGYVWDPPTTMFRHGDAQCPACGTDYVCDYGNDGGVGPTIKMVANDVDD